MQPPKSSRHQSGYCRGRPPIEWSRWLPTVTTAASSYTCGSRARARTRSRAFPAMARRRLCVWVTRVTVKASSPGSGRPDNVRRRRRAGGEAVRGSAVIASFRSDGVTPPLLPLTVDEVGCGVIGGEPQLLGHCLDALCRGIDSVGCGTPAQTSAERRANRCDFGVRRAEKRQDTSRRPRGCAGGDLTGDHESRRL